MPARLARWRNRCVSLVRSESHELQPASRVTADPRAEPPRGHSAWLPAAAPPGVGEAGGSGRSRGPSRTTWPLPRRAVDHLVLDTPRATFVYWASVALVVGGLFATRLLPCVDYPQHLALSDVARRLADPAAPENVRYQLNYFTYNGLFHVLVAWLSRALPIEAAGRCLVAVSVVALAGAAVALVRVLRRPPIVAALFTPILFSFSLGWGFVNYVLGTAIAAWALVFVVRVVVRPTVVGVLAVSVLGVACAFAHVLAMIILCVAAASLALEVGWRSAPRSGSPWRRALRAVLRATLAGLPLLLGCLYCIEVYRLQYDWDPNMYRDPTLEGVAPPVWQKIVWFRRVRDRPVLGRERPARPLGGAADHGRVGVARVEASSRGRLRAGGAAADGRALRDDGARLPGHAHGPDGHAPHFSPTGAVGGAGCRACDAELSAPWPREASARSWSSVPRAGMNLLLHCALFGWETADASTVIDELPPGRAVTAVIWDPWTIAFRNGTLTHLAAYYAARKHAEWSFAFARYLSVPVRFKPSSQPAWPARGWEFDAEAYDPRCQYARAFPLVIIKAPEGVPRDASGEARVRQLVFKRDADAAKLLSHHGRFWAFDSAGLPADGSL